MPTPSHQYTVTRTGLLTHINDLIARYDRNQNDWDDEDETFYGELCAMALTVGRGLKVDDDA